MCQSEDMGGWAPDGLDGNVSTIQEAKVEVWERNMRRCFRIPDVLGCDFMNFYTDKVKGR